LLARECDHAPDVTLTVRVVYQTTKGQSAVYTRVIPRWSTYTSVSWESWGWSPKHYRLDVYDLLDTLRAHISATLYASVIRKRRQGAAEIEMLDI
jgi:EXLDI family protein